MVANHSEQKTGKKILGIIDELHTHETLGVTELADHLDIAKSTAHYHLNTLCEEGYIIQDGRKYRLSLQFLRVGELTRSRTPIYEIAKTEIDKIAEQTGELAIIGTEEQGLGVYLYKAGSENAIDIDAPIGRFAYLHNRAYGKAILAYLNESRTETILEKHGLPQTSDRTITDYEEFQTELKKIRSRGFAINEEESINGIYGIAVPILSGNGSPLGAISLAGPLERMKAEKTTSNYIDILSEARNIIELNTQDQSF